MPGMHKKYLFWGPAPEMFILILATPSAWANDRELRASNKRKIMRFIDQPFCVFNNNG
jgi:hypothetical protein